MLVVKNPIFVAGAHKSGTSLLRSLFDGHPSVFVIPVEAHFLYHARYWIDYPYRASRPPLRNGQELRRAFAQWIRTCARSEDRFADSLTAGSWDFTKLDTVLNAPGESGSIRDEIDRFVEAMWISLGGEREQWPGRFLEKSVENAEIAPFLKAIYPDAKFVHIIRNPYANLVSLRRYKRRPGGKYPELTRLLRSIRSSFYHLFRNRETIENYRVLRYEDLVTDPGPVVSDLAKWLGIDVRDDLLTPTQLGAQWTGNSTTGRSFSAVSSDQLHAWREEVRPLEIRRVNETVGFALDEFGYEKLDYTSRTIIPMRDETPMIYLLNRLGGRFV